MVLKIGRSCWIQRCCARGRALSGGWATRHHVGSYGYQRRAVIEWLGRGFRFDGENGAGRRRLRKNSAAPACPLAAHISFLIYTGSWLREILK